MISIFSRADNRFLPDRYVTGTCPHCGYDQARGDQCENCTRVLDPADLINPRSAISGSPDIENPQFEVSVFETDRVRRKAAELDRGASKRNGQTWSRRLH